MKDRLLKAMGWSHTMLKCKIWNITLQLLTLGPQCYPQCNIKMQEHNQLHLAIPMSLGSWTCSHKLCVWDSIMTSSLEYQLLLVGSTCTIIRKKCDNLLDKHDNFSVILKSLPRMISTYMHAIFSWRELLLQRIDPLLRKESHTRWDVYLIPWVKVALLIDNETSIILCIQFHYIYLTYSFFFW